MKGLINGTFVQFCILVDNASFTLFRGYRLCKQTINLQFVTPLACIKILTVRYPLKMDI